MRDGAEILVRSCAGVRPGDQVVVVTDPDLRPIAEALLDAAAGAGGTPTLVVPPPRSIDNEEPPETVGAALAGYLRPSGKDSARPASVRPTSSATLNAFAPGCRKIPINAESLPLYLPLKL